MKDKFEFTPEEKSLLQGVLNRPDSVHNKIHVFETVVQLRIGGSGESNRRRITELEKTIQMMRDDMFTLVRRIHAVEVGGTHRFAKLHTPPIPPDGPPPPRLDELLFFELRTEIEALRGENVLLRGEKQTIYDKLSRLHREVIETGGMRFNGVNMINISEIFQEHGVDTDLPF